jgi:putative endonuclease
MSENKELGRKGEELTCAYLQKKGFEILQRNFIHDRAEVDIVAEKEGMIVFVEVKTRMSAYLTDPAQLVSLKKQKQIIKAADAWIKKLRPNDPARFDVVIVVTNMQYTTIEHIEDAFYPML